MQTVREDRPESPLTRRVLKYSRACCPNSAVARNLLPKRALEFDNINITGQPNLKQQTIKRRDRNTGPRLFIDGRPIEGFNALAAVDHSGELADWLGTEPIE